jgi:predicted DNA-binding transcriptional regulator AlpA
MMGRPMTSNNLMNEVAADVRSQWQKTREFLTEAEVSEWLGLSQPTLSRHRRNGTGPAFVRLSTRRIGYRRGAIEAWLNERERSSVA